MFLTGTYLRSVDDKQRIAIPKALRDALKTDSGCVLYVAPGTDGALSLYPEEAFSRLADRLEQSSPTDREVRDYTRLFFARTSRVELDRQGRIRIPQELADLNGLGKDAVLLGVHDHLELWDQRRWELYLDEKRDRYDEIAEGAFDASRGSRPQPLPEVAKSRTPK